MIKHLAISIFLLGSVHLLTAQQCHIEGNFVPSYSQDTWDAMKRELKTSRNGELDTIMCTFFIMQNGRSGEKTVNLTSVYEVLDGANELFIETGVQFDVCEDPIIINDPDFFHLNTEEAKILHKENKRNNTINIYIAENVSALYNNGQEIEICGSSSFPDEPNDEKYILLNKDCFFRGRLLAHELGHFFGLLHTHDRSNGRELADGSNCATSGDLFCDTPADPQLSINTVDGCEYTGKKIDSQGNAFTPDVKNIMSYAPIACQQYFTDDQITHMAIIASNENAYLRRNCNLPDLTIVDAKIKGEFSPGESTIVEFRKHIQDRILENKVTFHIYFSLVEEEVGTLMHEFILTDFIDVGLYEQIEFTVPYGLPDGNGYIQIVIDPYRNILESNRDNNMATIPIAIDRSDLSGNSVFPNPTTGEIQYFLNDSERYGEFLINVYNTKGQKIITDKVEKPLSLIHI